MSISYPLTLPSAPSIKTVKFRIVNAVATSESPYSFATQVYKHTGQRLEAEVSLPPMERAEAEEWIAFFMKLNGQFGTFEMGDPDGTAPRGVGTGTPLVNGASQTGNSIITDGWTPSQTGILKTGDWMQIGSYMYKVLNDANSDGSGNATFDIWPNLRSSPLDNATITVNNAVTTWRLASNVSSWTANDLSHYGITFTAQEKL